MSDLKKKAQEVADAGRFGDSQLIHVAPEELRGLASLMPDGKLTTNPKTGLPEAFFFLPFLAGLGAAAAPAAAATTAGLTAAGTGALTGGLAAGAGAAGAGLAGLGAAAAPGAAGGLFGSTLAATAAPTAASGLAATGAATGGAGALAASAPVAATTAASALPTATGAAGAGAGAGATGLAGLSGAGQAGAALSGPASFANPAGAAAAGLTGAFPAAPGAVATGAGKAGLGGLLGGMDASKMLQYGALASMMMPQGGGGGGGGDGKSKKVGKKYDRGEQAEAPDGGANGGIDREFNYFPNARYYAGGGLVTGYAEGGLTSLMPEGGGGGAGGDEQLIDMTMAALQGQAPNADAIIQQFIQVFGPEALQDLIAKVQSGSGDGMSDSIPATVSGQGGSEPAALSEGEYVVPADVVSGLGNGSTQAGAQQLDGMLDRTRQMRGGGAVQPPAINPRAAMPM